MLLSRARWAEQKQLADGEKARADKVEEEVSTYPTQNDSTRLTDIFIQSRKLRKDLNDSHNGQTMLVDKLISFCKEVRMKTFYAHVCVTDFSPISFSLKPGAERTHRLLASLREELERRGTKFADSSVGG